MFVTREESGKNGYFTGSQYINARNYRRRPTFLGNSVLRSNHFGFNNSRCCIRELFDFDILVSLHLSTNQDECFCFELSDRGFISRCTSDAFYARLFHNLRLDLRNSNVPNPWRVKLYFLRSIDMHINFRKHRTIHSNSLSFELRNINHYQTGENHH